MLAPAAPRKVDSAARVQKAAPRRLISRIRTQDSRDASASAVYSRTPALLTSDVKPPKASMTRDTAFCASASMATSACIPMAQFPPKRPLSVSASRSAPAPSRSTMPTFAPSAQNNSAVADPIPPDPPVIMAILPSKRLVIRSSLLSRASLSNARRESVGLHGFHGLEAFQPAPQPFDERLLIDQECDRHVLQAGSDGFIKRSLVRSAAARTASGDDLVQFGNLRGIVRCRLRRRDAVAAFAEQATGVDHDAIRKRPHPGIDFALRRQGRSDRIDV